MKTPSSLPADPPGAATPASDNAAAPALDGLAYRHVLGQFATGVTVITTRTESGQFLGITASSFNSVSLQPPLILWSLATRSASMPVFRDNTHYVVNVLAANQLELCRRFATLKGDRFAGVPYLLSSTGAPILEGALAWFECHNRSRYHEGDHVIFVGQVERCGVLEAGRPADPLVFQDGRFHTIHTLE